MTASAAGRPLRSDAQRNRDAVVRAAQEVFAAKGLEAGVPEIAARAGVGKATVYRSFPTKEHLVAAVAVERLRWWEETARAAAGQDDAWGAFEALLASAAARQASDHAVAASMAATSALPEVIEARARVRAGLGELMHAAQRQGTMRPDARPEDVRVLFAGVARVLSQDGERDPAEWRRYAQFVADALRAR